MDVPVELAKIIINENSDQQVIVLKETEGIRAFPIVIGIVEVFAIDRRLKGIEPPRPLTHDLMAKVIGKLGGELIKVVVDDLRDHTFFAKIHLKQGEQTLIIDSRPSDAIALGVATNTPLFVADHVLKLTCPEE